MDCEHCDNSIDGIFVYECPNCNEVHKLMLCEECAVAMGAALTLGGILDKIDDTPPQSEGFSLN